MSIKNTFHTKREKFKNFYPYIVYINGVKYFMFETGKQMPFSHVLKIHASFKDENLCFSTTCSELWRFFAIDCVDVYQVSIGRHIPLFYYDEDSDIFYETEVKETEKQREVVLTNNVAQIERIYEDF